MNCEDCKGNMSCLKPYESDEDIQLNVFGRTFTEEEWAEEGKCDYFEPICNGTGEVTDKAEAKSLVGHTAIKQMTIEELREQFEEHFIAIMNEATDFQIELMWESWKGCCISNNIIKE